MFGIRGERGIDRTTTVADHTYEVLSYIRVRGREQSRIIQRSRDFNPGILLASMGRNQGVLPPRLMNLASPPRFVAAGGCVAATTRPVVPPRPRSRKRGLPIEKQPQESCRQDHVYICSDIYDEMKIIF